MPFSEFFVKHRGFFFLNGRDIRKEALYMIREFPDNQIDSIASLRHNEAFYTLVNLLNARIRVKKDDFEKYPADLWKAIELIEEMRGTEQEKAIEIDVKRKI